MTDDHDLDALASAHLDGATTPEEAARVAADPAVRVRVEELRAVREAVAQVPPIDAAVRDDAIATALAALDERDAPTAEPAPVTALAARRGLSPRALRIVGAAAVVALLALLVPLLANVPDQDDDETASFGATSDAVDDGGATADEGNEEAAPEAGAGDVASGGGSAAGGATLGAFDDLDELAAALATGALVDRAAEPTTTSPGDHGPRCRPAPDERTIASYAVVAGAPVEVYLRTDPDGTSVMTVLAQGSCELLDERVL